MVKESKLIVDGRYGNKLSPCKVTAIRISTVMRELNRCNTKE